MRARRRGPLTHLLALPGDVSPQPDLPVTAGGIAPHPLAIGARIEPATSYTSAPAAWKILAMAHEIVEHYGPREEEERIAELRRSGMEVVFGDPEDRPCDLLPPEAFPTPEDVRPDPGLRRRGGTPDEETGPNSHAVYWRFFSSCAGWPVPPTPREFYDAIREENPSRRQRAVLRTWFREATNSEILWGWIEEAYTWPMLVAAVHRIGYHRNALNHYLNGFARQRNHAL